MTDGSGAAGMKRFLLPLFEKEKIYEAEKGICKVDTERKSEPQALHDSVYVCATCIAFYIYISAVCGDGTIQFL
jgi:hypothetical protein